MEIPAQTKEEKILDGVKPDVSVDFKLLTMDTEAKLKEVSPGSDIKSKTTSPFKAPTLEWGKTLVKKIKS